MPFKSRAQVAKFYELHAQGKMSKETIDRWTKETKNMNKLPERLTPKKEPAQEKEALDKSHAIAAGFAGAAGLVGGAALMNGKRKRDVGKAGIMHGNVGAFLQRKLGDRPVSVYSGPGKNLEYRSSDPVHREKLDAVIQHGISRSMGKLASAPSAFEMGFERRAKTASGAIGKAMDLAGLGLLAAPSISHFKGKEWSEKNKHKAEIVGLGLIAAPVAHELVHDHSKQIWNSAKGFAAKARNFIKK